MKRTDMTLFLPPSHFLAQHIQDVTILCTHFIITVEFFFAYGDLPLHHKQYKINNTFTVRVKYLLSPFSFLGLLQICRFCCCSVECISHIMFWIWQCYQRGSFFHFLWWSKQYNTVHYTNLYMALFFYLICKVVNYRLKPTLWTISN